MNDGSHRRRIPNYRARDGAYVREHFFGKYPELQAMVASMTDEEIWQLNRGGLDAQKVYAAYACAVKHEASPRLFWRKPSKVLVWEKRGEGKNITIRKKKMNESSCCNFVIDLTFLSTMNTARKAAFFKPLKQPELQFLRKCR